MRDNVQCQPVQICTQKLHVGTMSVSLLVCPHRHMVPTTFVYRFYQGQICDQNEWQL